MGFNSGFKGLNTFLSMDLFIYLVRKRQFFFELLGTENLTECPLGAVFLCDKAAELKDMIKWILSKYILIIGRIASGIIKRMYIPFE